MDAMVIDEWAGKVPLSPGTIRQYRGALRRLSGHLGDDGLLDVSVPQVREWIHASGACVSLAWSAVKSLTRWAVEEQLRREEERGAVLGYRWGKKRKRGDIRYIDPERVLDVITAAPSVMARAVCALAFGTGVRRQEMACLRWRDVDLTAGRLTVQHGKGGKQRMVPLLAWVAPYIDGHRGECPAVGPDDPVFPPHTKTSAACGICGGRHAHITTLHKAFKASCARASAVGPEIPADLWHLHAARHTYAVWMASRNVYVHFLRDNLGHSSLSVTETYLKVADGVRERETKKAGDAPPGGA